MTSTCPACRRVDVFTSPRTLLPGLSVQRCRRCGLRVSSMRRQRDVPAEYGRINDPVFDRAINRLRQEQAGQVLSFVPNSPNRDSTWLDVGCGFGYLLLESRKAGYQVFGVEPDEKACRHARQLLGKHSIEAGKMNDAVRPDASLDVISTLDVLEHVPAEEVGEFAAMIRRKLKPGGIWVLKTPSTEGIYFKTAHALLPFARPLVGATLKRLWQVDYEFPHTLYFSRPSLESFLKNAGFQIVRHGYLQDVPTGTILDRLRLDDTIPSWQVVVIAPAIFLLNQVQRLRHKSDALLMVARKENN